MIGKRDEIEIEILEDGTIKMSTDKVSSANHSSAETFIREVNKTAGGEVTRKTKAGFTQHKHSHADKFHTH